ncbi:hypothetical protein [uncultured Helicobacter sp.]|uniref:hypothetical protein n=1 Tax=uncultured Helicobacter sp. TaxID=175537 RepID=UPI0037507BA0
MKKTQNLGGADSKTFTESSHIDSETITESEEILKNEKTQNLTIKESTMQIESKMDLESNPRADEGRYALVCYVFYVIFAQQKWQNLLP